MAFRISGFGFPPALPIPALPLPVLLRYVADVKYLFRVFLLGLMCVASPALRAEDTSPVTSYLRLCETINRADRNYAAGATSAAFTDYRAAQKAIQELQSKYPGWNVGPVWLRLNHVTERLKVLAAKPSPNRATEPLPETAAPPRAAAAETPPWRAGANVTNEFRTVLNDLRAAEADNTMLLARLKEALAAQPAATNSIELRRAEEKMRAFQKENDRLRTELERPTPGTATSSAAETKRLRKALDDLNLQLKTQAAAAVALLAEKNLKLDSQGRQIASFTRERAELEQRIQTIATNNPLVAQLRGENAGVKQQLQSAQSLATTSTARLAEAQRQLEAAQALIGATGTLADGLRQTNALLLNKLSAAPKPEVLAQLTEENRRLKQQLAEAAPKAAPGTRAAELEQQMAQARSEISQLNQRLAAAPTPDTIAKLTSENQSLRQQLAAAQAKPQPTANTAAVQQILETTQTRLAAAESTVKTVQMENAALRQQLTPSQKSTELLTASAKAAALQVARTRQLEQQLAELQTRFAEADRQLATRSVKQLESKIESLNEQMLALRSRLSVYENKAVPYTREELALFRAPAITSVVAQSTLPRKRASSATASLEVSAEKLMAAGDLSQAEKKLTEVVQQDGKEVRALCNLALTQSAQGKYAEAEQNARKALALSANDAASLGALGQALASQERFDEALDVLSRAATLEPKNAGLQTLLGIALAKKGQRAQAETAFRKALQSAPRNAVAHRNLAVIYLTQQPPLIELARWHYQKSLAGGAAVSPEIESKIDAASGGPK